MRHLITTLLVLLLVTSMAEAAVTTFGWPGPDRPPQAPATERPPQAP